MFNFKLSHYKGYTYIELLGVIAIIALVITPMLFMMDSVLDKSLRSHTFNEANSVCISIMDRARFDIKLAGKEAVRSGAVSTDDYTYYNIPENYQVSLNIAKVSGSANLMSVDISLSTGSISLDMKSLVYYE